MAGLQSRNIVLDTSFFVGLSFNFRHKEIQTLEQLGDRGALRILLVDITVREVEKKISDEIDEAHARLGQSDLRVLRTLPLFRRFTDVYGKERMVSYVNRQFHEFIRRARAGNSSRRRLAAGRVR